MTFVRTWESSVILLCLPSSIFDFMNEGKFFFDTNMSVVNALLGVIEAIYLNWNSGSVNSYQYLFPLNILDTFFLKFYFISRDCPTAG